ncbi:OpgC domain-containing protein [Palleronia sp. LCG004]|uniref:OpgC family protein n=1 Tax=Palleronia sp. LCG004 TaxID=3079304 RepID=UPI002942B0E2|nr:OpgC domain-containing protein [Palleronia sp. LCG004]WOI56736.1 OpgC domain-containing protein [Palleronia sp. LCG004]
MSSGPDTERRKIVAFPSKLPQRTIRDPRIDVFRGLALIMIVIDHIPGNPYERFTLRAFGFSDAAEAFFLMSGIAAGIAYSGGFLKLRQGAGTIGAAVLPLWRRAWTLYLVQLFLTICVLGMYAWAADTFLRSEFRIQHNLGLIYSETGSALTGLATLSYQIGYVNILPVYIVLLLFAPIALWGAMRAPFVTLALSGALWLAGGWNRWNIPNDPGGGGWFFSPFAWQAIFVLGLVIGVRHRAGRRLVPISRPLLWTAITFLVLVLAWRNIPALGIYLNHKMAQLGAMGVPFNVVSHNKTYLAAPRFLHMLALAYVVSCLPWITRACASRGAAAFRLLGRQGLVVFAGGTILAMASQILMDVEPDVAWLGLVLPVAAVAMLFVIAGLKDGWTIFRARKAPPEEERESSVAVSK